MMETNSSPTHNDYPMPQPPSMADPASSGAVEAMISEYQHILDQIQPSKQATSKKKIVTFPVKLYLILKLAPKYDMDHIISWQVHGRNFVIRDRTLFLHQIANRLFESTKFSSFQRQLNVYDFQIVPTKHKTDKGAYYHPQFLRGRFDLCQTMVRVRIGGERRRSSTSSSQSSISAVPNFYALPYCYDHEDGPTQRTSLGPPPAAHPDKSTSPEGSPGTPTTDAYIGGNSNRFNCKSEPFHGAIQLQQGSSLHHQFRTWDSFDKIESGSREQFMNEMILLDGMLEQNISLIQALTRPERSFVPQLVSHDGSLCDYRTVSTMSLRPHPCKIDWTNVNAEAVSINMEYYKDDAASTDTSSTAGITKDAPTKVSLEHVLEEVEDEIQTIFEEDDFHGLLFHFVDDDEDDDCGSVASQLSAMFD